MNLGWGIIKCSRVVACAVLMLLWIPASLFAAEISLEQAVAIAVENNPDLAAVAKELVVARSEVQRANYISQFNPELVSGGEYRDRAGRITPQCRVSAAAPRTRAESVRRDCDRAPNASADRSACWHRRSLHNARRRH